MATKAAAARGHRSGDVATSASSNGAAVASRLQRLCAHIQLRPAAAGVVNALVPYRKAAADGSRLVFMTEGRDAAIDTQPHSIIDLRCLGSTSLLTEGYAMLPHHSNVDLALLAPHMDGPHTPGYLREVRCAREEYKLEMEALARVALCGQRLKMVMAGEGLFTRRSDVARNSPERVKRGGPVPASGVVHSDLGAGHGEHFGRSLWAHADGQRRLRRAGLTAEELRRCRLVILQLWRPISSSRPVERDPLAVLDPRTLSAQDLFGTGLHERDPADQGGLNPARFAVHNAEHRWVHISAQRKDEVLVYAGYDSGRQPMLPLFHTSVTVPFERAGVPEARASVDAVVFCWIDESATTLAA